MSTSPNEPNNDLLLHAILKHVARTEALALEGLLLQAKVCSGLLGGDADELVRTAEQRAYRKAEAIFQQLQAATT